MMFSFALQPEGFFLARHDTVGVDDEDEARALAVAAQMGQTGGRIAIVQENMREAIKMLGGAEVAGRA